MFAQDISVLQQPAKKAKHTPSKQRYLNVFMRHPICLLMQTKYTNSFIFLQV